MNYSVIINVKTSMTNQLIVITASQDEDYNTVCLLDYEYTKSHYRLIAVDLSRNKEVDADPKGIQQIEFFWQLKNADGVNAGGSNAQFMVLGKIKETRLKFCQENATVL